VSVPGAGGLRVGNDRQLVLVRGLGSVLLRGAVIGALYRRALLLVRLIGSLALLRALSRLLLRDLAVC